MMKKEKINIRISLIIGFILGIILIIFVYLEIININKLIGK
jgi:hypothetical protein